MCDTLVVVREGRVLFAKNSDRDPNEAQRLDWVPAAEHVEGSPLRCTWTVIPQVRRTHALLLSRPFWMWGAEMGANEHGVVIGNEAVFTDQPHEQQGLLGMDLLRLGLERAASAEQAVQVITELVHRHGQGGRCGYAQPGFRYHNSFLIADHRGAFVLETAGRDVATERVDQGARAISNGLTLAPLLPRADRIRGLVARCRVRRARMESLGASARAPAELAAALRDHGPDADAPRYSRLNGAMAAPCMHHGGLLAGSQTVASWVAELRADGARHWATGTAAPCLSLFRPLDVHTPAPAGAPEGAPDPSSLWWRFEALHRELLKDPVAARDMCAERDQLEQAAFDNPGDWRRHWQAADDWLARWQEVFAASPPADERPRWLRNRWADVAAQAAGGNRLPPWPVYG